MYTIQFMKRTVTKLNTWEVSKELRELFPRAVRLKIARANEKIANLMSGDVDRQKLIDTVKKARTRFSDLLGISKDHLPPEAQDLAGLLVQFDQYFDEIREDQEVSER